jgi:PIN domain nuclease of toxin-antitoxin system
VLYVLDAHTIIWHIDGSPQLTAAAQAVMDDRGARLVVPTIVLAEIVHLHGRGRIRVSPAQVTALLTQRPNATVRPLDQAVLALMPAGLEMHDAIIVATAMLVAARGSEPVRVITRDRQITASGLVDVLW